MTLGIIQPKPETHAPGTELLVDDERVSQHEHELDSVKHGSGAEGNIVLIPQPSEDPNDPLLWPRWKRETAFAVLFFNCIIFAACPGPMIAPATIALSIQLHVPVKKVAELSGYQLLIVGALGPVVSVLAQKYGKRPQFLIASLFGTIGTGICIAGFNFSPTASPSTLSHSYKVLLAGRMIQGIGTTAYESLSVAAIGDMFFLHERGLRTALLVLTLACLSSFVAIIAGTMFEHIGARNLFVVLLPIQALGLLGAVLGLPEMQFKRAQNGGTEGPSPSEEIKEKETGRDLAEDVGHEGRPVASAIPKRSFVQDLRVLSGSYTDENMLKLLAEIFIHILNPAIFWIMTVSAVLVSFFVGTAYVLAQIYTPPPYLLSVAQNGFFFTGALIGGILGISAGPICDLSARFLARRNKGLYEPEFRIPVCLLAVAVFALGWFTWGWALDHPEKGRVILGSFCYGAICFGTSVASTSAGLYILDAFRPQSTQIFILQMMIKNFLFYAFSTFINDFAAKSGPGHMCRVWGTVTVVGFVTCVPMYIFGKLNRVLVHKVWQKYLGGA